MKLDVSPVLQDLDGTPLTIQVRQADGTIVDTKKPMTLRSVLITGINSGTGRIDLSEHRRRYNLMEKIHAAKNEVDLTIDDANHIRTLLIEGLAYGPVIVGQVDRLIENAAKVASSEKPSSETPAA